MAVEDAPDWTPLKPRLHRYLVEVEATGHGAVEVEAEDRVDALHRVQAMLEMGHKPHAVGHGDWFVRGGVHAVTSLNDKGAA